MSSPTINPNTNPQVHAMIVAAGRGSRFGTDIPKQYLRIHEQTLLQLSVARLASSAYINTCLLVVATDDTTAQALDFTVPVSYAVGGAERWQSVCSGLNTIIESGAVDDDLIVIHDAARPCVPTADIEQVIKVAMQEPYGAILATPVADTLKQGQTHFTDDSANLPSYIERTLDRTALWQALTPQVFRLGQLRQALAYVTEHQLSITDEASAFEQLNLPIRLVTGSRQNIKLTYPDDAVLITAILAAQSALLVSENL